MNKKIVLVTKLHEGIYPSQGGGKRQEVAEWNLGPLNVMAAVRSLNQEIRDNRRNYGSIGAGESWLEINGHRFTPDDFYFGDFRLVDARQVIADAA